jgi:hypothetical protein
MISSISHGSIDNVRYGGGGALDADPVPYHMRRRRTRSTRVRV